MESMKYKQEPMSNKLFTATYPVSKITTQNYTPNHSYENFTLIIINARHQNTPITIWKFMNENLIGSVHTHTH